MNVQQRVNEIIAQHCIWMAETIVEIEHRLKPDDMAGHDIGAELGQIRELVHQMTGSCGTVGYTEIGEAAAQLEDYLVDLIDRGDEATNKDDRDRLSVLFKQLASLIARARPEKSKIYRADAA